MRHLLENLTAFGTSSETSNSAVSAVAMPIPWQESRNSRIYRRAQNGAVGSVTSANVPANCHRLARPAR